MMCVTLVHNRYGLIPNVYFKMFSRTWFKSMTNYPLCWMLTEPDLFGNVYWGDSLRYLQGGDGGREGAAESVTGPCGMLAYPRDALQSFPKLKRAGRTGTINHGCSAPREQTQPCLMWFPGRDAAVSSSGLGHCGAQGSPPQKRSLLLPWEKALQDSNGPHFLEKCTIRTQGHLPLLPILDSLIFCFPLCWSGGCHVRGTWTQFPEGSQLPAPRFSLLLLLLSHFSCVWLCVTP